MGPKDVGSQLKEVSCAELRLTEGRWNQNGSNGGVEMGR